MSCREAMQSKSSARSEDTVKSPTTSSKPWGFSASESNLNLCEHSNKEGGWRHWWIWHRLCIFTPGQNSWCSLLAWLNKFDICASFFVVERVASKLRFGGGSPNIGVITLIPHWRCCLEWSAHANLSVYYGPRDSFGVGYERCCREAGSKWIVSGFLSRFIRHRCLSYFNNIMAVCIRGCT